MGLCRCRKVSSWYCFEDKQYCCATCVVTQHASHAVGSYIEWLEDSSFESPAPCTICGQGIADRV